MEEYPRLRLDEVLETFREECEKEQNDVDWTSGLHEDLQEGEDAQQVFAGVAGTRAAAEDQEVSAHLASEVWPDFLQDEVVREDSSEQKSMQDFKARAYEQCRWRNLGVTNKDPLIENMLHKLKAAARNLGTSLSERVWDRLAIDHSLTAEEVCSDLLKDMHEKALAVTNWRKDDAVLLSKASFFDRVPAIAELKYDGRLHSLQAKYEAIKGLINKHSGELVEAAVGVRLGGWVLQDRIQSLTDADRIGTFPPQFESNEDGKTSYERQESMDRIPDESSNERLCLEMQMKEIGHRDNLDEIKGLLPDWSAQRFRIVCPCKNNTRYIWVRTSSVISLGELFLHLSDTFNAASIYYLYLHCPIVAVKRRKSKGRQALPAQQSRTGMAAAGLSGACLQQKQPWKHTLVTDYCKLSDGDAVVPTSGTPAWKDAYRKAIRHIHALILQDLSPPFLEQAFRGHPWSKQTLHSYSRATFLWWDEAASIHAFGHLDNGSLV